MEQLYFAVSWALVGLIWVIQLVKYPAFHFVDVSRFVEYHQHHTRSITIIVAPLMMAELALTGWLLWQSGWSAKYLISAAVVGAIWLSTMTLQIPQHQVLDKKKNEKAIDKLIKTNWIRTILWTLKGIWLLGI
ncbi:MAG: hypothetical protein AAFZ15_09345 [Bacteroidota bacterium]